MISSALPSGTTPLTNNTISLDILLFPPLNGLKKKAQNYQRCKKRLHETKPKMS